MKEKDGDGGDESDESDVLVKKKRRRRKENKEAVVSLKSEVRAPSSPTIGERVHMEIAHGSTRVQLENTALRLHAISLSALHIFVF